MEAGSGPRVVCLCGSLRFGALLRSERERLTSEGVIVLGPESIGAEPTPAQRRALGELHLRRIDLADEVRVVSQDGYLGEATRREIRYARDQGTAVTFVEAELDR